LACIASAETKSSERVPSLPRKQINASVVHFAKTLDVSLLMYTFLNYDDHHSYDVSSRSVSHRIFALYRASYTNCARKLRTPISTKSLQIVSSENSQLLLPEAR